MGARVPSPFGVTEQLVGNGIPGLAHFTYDLLTLAQLGKEARNLSSTCALAGGQSTGKVHVGRKWGGCQHGC